MAEADPPSGHPTPRVLVVRRIVAAIGAVVAVTVLAVAAVMVLGGDPAPPDDYDDSVSEAFLAVCTADATNLGFAAPDRFCGCSFDRIRAELPYERFVEIDAAMREDPGAVPDDIDRIRTDCYVSSASVVPTTAPTAPTTPSANG